MLSVLMKWDHCRRSLEEDKRGASVQIVDRTDTNEMEHCSGFALSPLILVRLSEKDLHPRRQNHVSSFGTNR